MVVALILPILQTFLFCLGIGRNPSLLKVAVVDDELGRSFMSSQNCPVYEGCNYTLLSCRYLEALNRKGVSYVSKIKTRLKQP